MLISPKYKVEFKQLLSLSIPIAIGELSGVLMNLIDTIMIGDFGADAVAAISISSSIFLLFAILGIGSSMVVAPMVATAFAKKDYYKCKTLWYGSLLYSCCISIFLMLCILLSVYNLDLLNQKQSVYLIAKTFLLYIAPSVVPMILYLQFKHFADGLSMPKIGMVMSFSALMVDISLNWLLIYGNWGFPRLGVDGAAITNSVAQSLVAIGMFYFLTRSSSFKQIKKSGFVGFKNARNESIIIIKEALPVGFQTLLEYAAFGFGAIMVGWLKSATQLAAHQIALNIATSTFMIVLAIGAGGAIRVGQAVAVGNKEGMLLSGKVSLITGILFVTIPCILFITIPSMLADIFIDDVQVIAVAIPLIITAGIFQISDSMQSISQALLRGLGDFRFPSLVTFISFWLIGMPIGAVLCFYYDWNALGIWAGFLISLFIQAYIFGKRFFKLVKKWE